MKKNILLGSCQEEKMLSHEQFTLILVFLSLSFSSSLLTTLPHLMSPAFRSGPWRVLFPLQKRPSTLF